MADFIEVVPATDVNAELVEAVESLVRQLSNSATVPRHTDLLEMVESSCTVLLLARDRSLGGKIVGMLTLVVFRIPTGVRAWIEDVAVDETARGRGVGEALSREALRIAMERGSRTVELSSRPSREAANRLYRRLGFVPRDTNVYRYTIDRSAG